MAGASPPKQEDLKRALKEFLHSPRYSLFKGVEVGRLLPDGVEATGRLRELTFEDLTRLYSTPGGESIFSAEQEAGLLHLVRALVEEEQDRMAAIDSEQAAGDEVQNSVQTELELRQILKEVTSHPQYETVRHRRLGEYWGKNWTPAPFEESMTIGQLASFDLAVLFKKKMVSDTRVQSIYRALELACAELSGPRKERVTSLPSSSMVAPSLNQSLGVLAYYEILQKAKSERTYPELHTIVERFLDTFTFDECAHIVSTQKLSASCLKRLAPLIKEGFTAATCELITALLRGPATRVDHIALILHGSDRPISALSRIIATIVARGLGATAVVMNGEVVEGLWTLNPQLLSMTIAELAQRKAAQRRSLNVDPILLDILKQSEKTHGRSVPRRKERRNRLKSRPRSGK
jgi:hypothetical protein